MTETRAMRAGAAMQGIGQAASAAVGLTVVLFVILLEPVARLLDHVLSGRQGHPAHRVTPAAPRGRAGR